MTKASDEMERLLWNFLHAARAWGDADATPDRVTKDRAMEQSEVAIKELAKALDRRKAKP